MSSCITYGSATKWNSLKIATYDTRSATKAVVKSVFVKHNSHILTSWKICRISWWEQYLPLQIATNQVHRMNCSWLFGSNFPWKRTDPCHVLPLGGTRTSHRRENSRLFPSQAMLYKPRVEHFHKPNVYQIATVPDCSLGMFCRALLLWSCALQGATNVLTQVTTPKSGGHRSGTGRRRDYYLRTTRPIRNSSFRPSFF